MYIILVIIDFVNACYLIIYMITTINNKFEVLIIAIIRNNNSIVGNSIVLSLVIWHKRLIEAASFRLIKSLVYINSALIPDILSTVIESLGQRDHITVIVVGNRVNRFDLCGIEYYIDIGISVPYRSTFLPTFKAHALRRAPQ